MTYIERLKIISLAVLLALAPTVTLAAETKADGENVNQQVTCLTKNAYYEARGQSKAGKIAVMHVVMNRTRDSRFPITPCKVVQQRQKGHCQFSWVCTGSSGIHEKQVYNDLQGLARLVYDGEIHDNTNGAKFFHNVNVHPNWRGCKTTTKIGAHIFCR